MAFYGYLTQQGRHKVIDREQTGAASEMTLPEQLERIDGDIEAAVSMAYLYIVLRDKKRISPEQAQRMIETANKTAEGFRMKREILLAQLYASNIPFRGGKMLLAKAAK